MSSVVLEHLARGNFLFLQPTAAEIERLIPSAERVLPDPTRIFLEDESLDPVIGYPLLASDRLETLESGVADLLDSELEAQVARIARRGFDSKTYRARWETYRSLIAQITESCIATSQVYDFGSVFWLHHSSAVARRLNDIPKRLRRTDSALAREHGDALKYHVYDKWISRIGDVVHEVAQSLAPDLSVRPEALVPALLEPMRTNELVFTEDYIGPDLSELQSFFHGRLEIDGRNLRQRYSEIEIWLRDVGRHRADVRAGIDLTGGLEEFADVAGVLHRRGFLRYLTALDATPAGELLDEARLEQLERILDRVATFEVFRALRRMTVPITVEGERLVSRDRSANSTWIDGPSVLELSSATRPTDFFAPQVVDPVVERFGLVYDLTDFSATISRLGRRERGALDQAFRLAAQFQRHIDRLAVALGQRFEKYLGDGAFYSSRQPHQMLAMAIGLQRLYPEFVSRGLPFDSGMRLALNYGEYRLLPLDGARGDEQRFEFFGHGLVELSRLSTGKKTQQLEAFKTLLVSNGYPEAAVNKFFAPMLRKDAELVSKVDERRPFYAYINQTNTLINEGIVVTEAFLDRLGDFRRLAYGRLEGRGFVAIEIADWNGAPLLVGLRKLGMASFKGLEPTPVFEVVDGGGWQPSDLRPIPRQPLLSSLERLFTRNMTAATRPRETVTAGAQPASP